MPRINPFTLQMQITRLFEQGQSFFATTKVQDWLRERNEDPEMYTVQFHERPASPGEEAAMVIEIELQRRDGQPVDAWLQAEANRHA
ncbi:MAG: hypothetical protein IGR80_15780 [Synechococcales cyanobacterium K44_A2020_017]|jgi:hypothetical protein|uniref:hypothetical protein n=1 Tax=Leptolyngbya sp. CCY15150 TaxID=2767772 RepID=UPI001951BAD8|nr:hypothetical protein [Leptolyngbya sp. CCY15150]MBF2087577.1 hypothetical protein [Synechococcales cyanobacterium K32_A2020_035]MBF2096198.1 hypothetical protein [Synechococcales cyanobacterium K44_A2020_017]